MEIQRLIWDAWNVAHIARHEVTPREVEDVCSGERLMIDRGYRERFRVVGPANECSP